MKAQLASALLSEPRFSCFGGEQLQMPHACVFFGTGSYKAVSWTLQNLYREGDVLHLLHVVPASSVLMPQAFGLAHVLPPEEGLQEQMVGEGLAVGRKGLIETSNKQLSISFVVFMTRAFLDKGFSAPGCLVWHSASIRRGYRC
jgi:hypothetical protein